MTISERETLSLSFSLEREDSLCSHVLFPLFLFVKLHLTITFYNKLKARARRSAGSNVPA